MVGEELHLSLPLQYLGGKALSRPEAAHFKAGVDVIWMAEVSTSALAGGREANTISGRDLEAWRAH